MMTPAVAARLASWQAPCSTHEVAARIANLKAASARRLGHGLAVQDPYGSGACGWISAEIPEGERDFAMVTYWIGENFQGYGLMRRAAPEAMSRLFEALQVPMLRAAVQLDNDRSISLLESLGGYRLGNGQIWCSARDRYESCFFYGLPRQ